MIIYAWERLWEATQNWRQPRRGALFAYYKKLDAKYNR
jgi:hypothetical protein